MANTVYIRLCSLGQTDVMILVIKDGVVLPDEDITQDPEGHVASAEASHAAVGAL